MLVPQVRVVVVVEQLPFNMVSFRPCVSVTRDTNALCRLRIQPPECWLIT